MTDQRSELSLLLGLTVLRVERELPADHPSRREWDLTTGRLRPAREATGPYDSVARQRWRLYLESEDGRRGWVALTSHQVRQRVRRITDVPKAGRTALRLMHEIEEAGNE
jgi:hypothetical protein